MCSTHPNVRSRAAGQSEATLTSPQAGIAPDVENAVPAPTYIAKAPMRGVHVHGAQSERRKGGESRREVRALDLQQPGDLRVLVRRYGHFDLCEDAVQE